MKKDILISVIITVYNIEKYLTACLESIINQTYKNLEIILVDDGSSDNSSRICDEYALKDERVKVIHKQNGGLVAARKSGLTIAMGEIVTYVDADDWIELDFYEKMIDLYKRNNADVILSGCIKETEKKQVFLENNLPEGYYDKAALEKEVYPRMLYYEGFYKFGVQQYLWNKLYKKELLEKHQMKVDNTINNGEDVACLFPLLLDAESIEISNIHGYHYRIHGDAMTAKLNEDYPVAINLLYMYLKKIFDDSIYRNVVERQLLMYYTYMSAMFAKYVLGVRMIPEFQYEFVFPFEKILSDSKVMLVIKGKRGKEYSAQLQRTKLCSLVETIDLGEGISAEVIIDKIETKNPDVVVWSDENHPLFWEMKNYVEQKGYIFIY